MGSKVKESILNNDSEERDEQSVLKEDRESILSSDREESTLSDRQLEERESIFMEGVAKNGMKILEVIAQPVKDTDKKIKISTLLFFKMNEIRVKKVDFSLRGYAKINNGDVEIPLVKSQMNKRGPWYFGSKDEAIEKWEDLTRIELSAVEEQLEIRKKAVIEAETAVNDAEEAIDYLQDVLKNKRF